MARTASKHSPPHAIPRHRPATFVLHGRGSVQVHSKRTPFRSRLASFVLPLVAFGLTALGCGRTDYDFGDSDVAEQMNYDVDVERDVELEDASVVHVELVFPAPPAARSDLMGLVNGVPLEDVLDAVCPDGSPIIELDNTGELPMMLVYMDDGLRAVIWL